MRAIADANVLLPLLAEGHAHHAPASAWWDGCEDDSVGLCLPVQMALLRLLTNVRVMGSSILRPEQAWDVLEELIDDPRIVVVDQVPMTHSANWRANIEGREPTPDLWADAWLAALAQATDCEMTTFDKGFRSFANLRLLLLSPAA